MFWRCAVWLALVSATPVAAGAERRAVESIAPAHASIGSPWFGQLGPGAVQLPSGPGYTIRRSERTWGAPNLVYYVMGVLGSMHAKHPLAHTLAIGDISERSGAKITLHRSHQAGRDIDIGFYYNKIPATYPRDFVNATIQTFDSRLNWQLLQRFLALRDLPGGVQVVFVDYQVQRWLFEYGQSIGVPLETLLATFQYPRGPGAPDAIVRHIPNHLDHFHVRFRCGERDYFCE